MEATLLLHLPFQHAVGVVESQLAGLAEVVTGLILLAAVKVADATVEEGLGKVGLLLQGGGEVVDSLANVFPPGMYAAPVVEQVGVVRPKLQGMVQVGKHTGRRQFGVSTLAGLKETDTSLTDSTLPKGEDQ